MLPIVIAERKAIHSCELGNTGSGTPLPRTPLGHRPADQSLPAEKSHAKVRMAAEKVRLSVRRELAAILDVIRDLAGEVIGLEVVAATIQV